MNLLGALIGGVIAGLIGAAVWCGLSVYANVEIGWVAWGIGGLVGLGVALGSKGGTIQTGALAALLSAVSIVGGKYAAVELAFNREFADISIEENFTNDEYVVSYLADDIVEQKTQAGEELAWPEDADVDFADGPEDYPADVWAEADRQWGSMSVDEQESFRTQRRDSAVAGFASFRSELMAEAFKASFGGLDILFFALAVFTAFKLGMSTIGDADSGKPDR